MDKIVGNIEKVETLKGTIRYPGVGDSAYEVAVNNGFVGTEKEWLASLEGYTPQKYVDYYTETEQEEVKASILSKVQPQIDSIEETAERAEVIAKGRATGYVFNTTEDLDLWLQNSANTSKLVLGDNLYIKELGVPDYWWDGSEKQLLETQKVDLTEYIKEEESDKIIKDTLINSKTNWTADERINAGLDYNLFGLGTACKGIFNGDLNVDCGNTTGFYRGDNLKNSPPVLEGAPASWFYVLHMVHDEKHKKQVGFDLWSNKTYTRTEVGGEWSPWIETAVANTNCNSYSGDLNNLYGTGFYMGYNLQNAPDTGTTNADKWIYVMNMSHNNAFQKQVAFDFFSNKTYTRTQVGGTWGNWEQISIA